MTTYGDRLHRRRCIGFRVAFFFGIGLAIINRDNWVLLGIALGALVLIAVVYWRDCRRPRHDS